MSDERDFDLAAERRWRAGVNLYRAGDASRPFKGDPIAEGMSECLDLALYTREALRCGALHPTAAHVLNQHARAAWRILRTAQQRHGGGQ